MEKEKDIERGQPVPNGYHSSDSKGKVQCSLPCARRECRGGPRRGSV